MKKIILGLILASTITTAYAKGNQKEVITLNFGAIENTDGGESEYIYGASYFQTKGKNNLGLAYNLDFLKMTDEYSGIEVETVLFAPSVGFSLGLTNNLYLVPSAGLSYLKAEASMGDTSASESEWGFNIGTDLMYKFNNGLTLGVGTRYTTFDIDNGDLLQVQGKIGFAF